LEVKAADVMQSPMNAMTAIDQPMPVKLRIEDFELLHNSGALDAYGKSQLIEGVIVQMSPQLLTHVYVKNELAWRLRQAILVVEPSWSVFIEATVALPPHNLPDPDICITDAKIARSYVPVDTVKLLVEAADSSLRIDLETKAALYASFGVPEYWVADIKGRCIHQFWDPGNAGYQKRERIRFDTPITAATMAWLTIETNDLA
jgi:Uma2 family endonuclease